MVCCAKISSVICFALQSSTNKQTALARFSGSVGEMFAVPAAIVALWLASLTAQIGVVWPNYQSEQKEKSEQTGTSSAEEKSENGKSQQREKSSPESKPRRADQSSPTAASKERRRQHQE